MQVPWIGWKSPYKVSLKSVNLVSSSFNLRLLKIKTHVLHTETRNFQLASYKFEESGSVGQVVSLQVTGIQGCGRTSCLTRTLSIETAWNVREPVVRVISIARCIRITFRIVCFDITHVNYKLLTNLTASLSFIDRMNFGYNIKEPVRSSTTIRDAENRAFVDGQARPPLSESKIPEVSTSNRQAKPQTRVSCSTKSLTWLVNVPRLDWVSVAEHGEYVQPDQWVTLVIYKCKKNEISLKRNYLVSRQTRWSYRSLILWNTKEAIAENLSKNRRSNDQSDFWNSRRIHPDFPKINLDLRRSCEI